VFEQRIQGWSHDELFERGTGTSLMI